MALNLTDLIEKIPGISDAEVTKALSHEHFIVRTKAICEAVSRNLNDSATIEAIRALKSDSTRFWNQYLIQDFAFAALDILGVETWQGQNERIDALVESQLHFD